MKFVSFSGMKRKDGYADENVLMGLLVDEVLNEHNRRRLLGKRGLRSYEVQQYLEAIYETMFIGREFYLNGTRKKDLVAEAKLLAVAILKRLAPRYEPLEVQPHRMRPLPGKDLVFVHGTADIYADGPLIIDHKTAGSGLWTPSRAKSDPQLKLYRFLFAEGRWPAGAYAVAERGTGKTLWLDAGGPPKDVRAYIEELAAELVGAEGTEDCAVCLGWEASV